MSVRILGISGSPRHGATEYSVREALKAAGEVKGVETAFIGLAGKRINNCLHCDRCLEEKQGICPVFRDDVNELLPLISSAHGFIIGTPVYSMNTSGLLQNFLNRFRPIGVNMQGHNKYIRVAGGIATGGMRNGGSEMALAAINNFALVSGMTVVSGGTAAYNGASVWARNRQEPGAREDEAGMNSVRVVGRRVAVMTKILVAGYNVVQSEIPEHLLAGFGSPEEMAEFYQNFVSTSTEP